jgi:hypothetical protein
LHAADLLSFDSDEGDQEDSISTVAFTDLSKLLDVATRIYGLVSSPTSPGPFPSKAKV